jgi:copper chaperone CopZ
MSTTSYQVTGLTCGHCVVAVTNELRALPEVSDVAVDLVAGGVSTVTVTSAQPLAEAAVAAALDEAGYSLASR